MYMTSFFFFFFFCYLFYLASMLYTYFSCICTVNQILKVEGPGLYSIPTTARSLLKGLKYYIVPLDDVCE